MGLFDEIEKKLEGENGQDGLLDKAAEQAEHFVDGKTGGKYTEQIDKGGAALENQAEQHLPQLAEEIEQHFPKL